MSGPENGEAYSLLITRMFSLNYKKDKLDSLGVFRNSKVTFYYSGSDKIVLQYFTEKEHEVRYGRIDLKNATINKIEKNDYFREARQVQSELYDGEEDFITFEVDQKLDVEVNQFGICKLTYGNLKKGLRNATTGLSVKDYLIFSGRSTQSWLGNLIAESYPPNLLSNKIVRIQKEFPLPSIDSFQLFQQGTKLFAIVQFDKDDNLSRDFIDSIIKLKGVNITERMHNPLHLQDFYQINPNEYRNISTNFKPLNSDRTKWMSQLEFGKLDDDLRVQQNDTIKLILQQDFKGNRINVTYDLGNYRYRISRIGFLEENKSILIPILAVILFYLFFVFLLYTSPIQILRIYNSRFFSLVDEISSKYGGNIIRKFINLFFERWFVQNKITLDAWINRNKDDIINAFLTQKTVEEHPYYVPLPTFSKRTDGKIISEFNKPSAELLSALFSQKRTVIEIIGTGGIGKTTLAIEMARWLIDKEIALKYFHNHLWLPILIEEEIRNGEELVKIVKRKINSWINHSQITESFLIALLEKQRIVIIIDALSERSSQMQETIQRIHGQGYPVNALIITSRIKLDLEILDYKLLYPNYLNNSQLAYFIEQTLFLRKSDLFKTRLEKAELLNRILLLLVFKNTEIPISPILVELILTNLIRLEKSGSNKGTNNENHFSILSIYINYIRSVNKRNFPSEIENLSEDVVKFIAKLSLNEKFIPGDINRNDCISAIRKEFNSDGNSFVQKNVLNGIIKEDNQGVIPTIRFILDPISEFLAAIYYAERLRGDRQKWVELYKQLIELHIDKKVENKSFISSILIVHDELKTQLNLPDPLSLEEYSILMSSVFKASS